MFDNLFISYSKWFLDICPILKQEDNLSQISVTAYSIHFHLSSSRDGHLLHLQSEKGSCGVNDQITVYLSVLYDKGKSVPLQARRGPRGFQKVKVPRFRDNGTGWW